MVAPLVQEQVPNFARVAIHIIIWLIYLEEVLIANNVEQIVYAKQPGIIALDVLMVISCLDHHAHLVVVAQNVQEQQLIVQTAIQINIWIVEFAQTVHHLVQLVHQALVVKPVQMLLTWVDQFAIAIVVTIYLDLVASNVNYLVPLVLQWQYAKVALV